MSEQTTVHLRWTVPCSLAHTAGTHGTRNELQSDLPRCILHARAGPRLPPRNQIGSRAAEMPLKQRLQSTGHSPSARGGGSSAGSEVLQVDE